MIRALKNVIIHSDAVSSKLVAGQLRLGLGASHH